MSNEDQEGGFVSHLTELRKRLINSFIFLFIFFVICYLFAEHIYGFLVDPFAKAVKEDGSDRRLILLLLVEELKTQNLLNNGSLHKDPGTSSIKSVHRSN